MGVRRRRPGLVCRVLLARDAVARRLAASPRFAASGRAVGRDNYALGDVATLAEAVER